LLTIHNTRIPQVSNLFSIIAVFISFLPLALLLLLLRQLRIFAAAAAARAPTPPRPPFLGEGKYQKKKIACSVGVGGWKCLRRRGRGGVGVCCKLVAVFGSPNTTFLKH
jgi:hypothetical protein